MSKPPNPDTGGLVQPADYNESSAGHYAKGTQPQLERDAGVPAADDLHKCWQKWLTDNFERSKKMQIVPIALEFAAYYSAAQLQEITELKQQETWWKAKFNQAVNDFKESKCTNSSSARSAMSSSTASRSAVENVRTASDDSGGVLAIVLKQSAEEFAAVIERAETAEQQLTAERERSAKLREEAILSAIALCDQEYTTARNNKWYAEARTAHDLGVRIRALLASSPAEGSDD